MSATPRAPAWYRALDLRERIALARSAESGDAPSDIGGAPDQDSPRRLTWWKEQPPFNRTTLFADRLACDGITEEELETLLREPDQALCTRAAFVPDWMATLERILANWGETDGLGEWTPGADSAPGVRGFARLLRPFVAHGAASVRTALADLVQTRQRVPFDPDALGAWLRGGLLAQLATRLARTVALEINIARLEGRLEGGTPQARFDSFVEQLSSSPAIDAFFQEYPVLARQLVVAIEHWADFTLEFAQHLCDDWEQLCATFADGGDPGPLVDVEADAAESHRRGRRVLKLRFEAGLRLVYKPKPLAVDMHFQELLTWVNARDGGRDVAAPQFRTFRVLDRGAYGWTEFVEPAACVTVAEVAAFYERLGGLLALLYALEATDFHCENVVAAGGHPVLVDLEALFQPRVEGYALTAHGDPAITTLGYSVLRTGLLPERIGGNEREPGIDASGVGGLPGQRSPRPVETWEAFGTDEMRLVQRHVTLEGSHNRPTLNDAAVEVVDYLGDVLHGFTRTYRTLMRYRDDLLAGPLRRFRDDRIRVIVRSTKSYNEILVQSYHPDFLRDALDRDRFLDSLWRGVELRPFLARLVAAERADVRDGDVPHFTARADSRDVCTPHGEIIRDVFDEPSWNVVRHRIGCLSEHDLRQQLWFIRASFATLLLGQPAEPWKSSHLTLPGGTSAPTRHEYLAAARAVGDRLGELALRDGDVANWVGLGIEDERGWQLQAAGMDLYSGTSGLTLFLAYLGAVSGDAAYTALARSALACTLRQLELLHRWRQSPPLGAFTGLGGVIYVLSHLGTLWSEPALFDDAESLTTTLPELIAADETYDVVGGSAGCIASLLSLYAARPHHASLELATRCGDHLIAQMQPVHDGVGWLNPRIADAPLTGFAHGAAGIAWSLLELTAVTGEARFRDTALRALVYERSLFCPAERNWPDLRRIAMRNGIPAFSVAWCHGAPGIGLSRLASLPYCDDRCTREEIAHAVATTLAHGFGLNHCLCHGDLGNLELLQLAALTLDDPEHRRQCDQMAASVLESIHRDGWITGLPLGLEAPGLMSGLAGIGYALLRLADPGSVPSVLLLAPPG